MNIGRNKINLDIYKNTNKMLPNYLIGQSLNMNDWKNKSRKYFDFVEVLAGVFKYDSEVLMDVLNKIKEDDENNFYEMLLSKSLNLPLLKEKIDDLNIGLKKGQKISEKQWQTEVLPMFKEIV